MLSPLFGSGHLLITNVPASVPSLVLYMKRGQLKDMKSLAQCQRDGKRGIWTRAMLYIDFPYKSRMSNLSVRCWSGHPYKSFCVLGS